MSNSLWPPWTIVCQTPLSMEILQTRIPEGVAVPSSRGSSQPRDWTLVSYVSCFGRRVFSTSATYNSCLNKAYAPRIFSMRHITAFPHAGTWEALQSCMWGSFLNSKSCTPLRKKKKKKEQKRNNKAWKKQRTLVCRMRWKWRPQLGNSNCHLSMSADEHENAAGVDLGITNTF